METMVPGRINGTELMVPTQEIMVPTGPDIRVAKLALHLLPVIYYRRYGVPDEILGHRCRYWWIVCAIANRRSHWYNVIRIFEFEAFDT